MSNYYDKLNHNDIEIKMDKLPLINSNLFIIVTCNNVDQY
jgi:hypothetical protein